MRDSIKTWLMLSIYCIYSLVVGVTVVSAFCSIIVGYAAFVFWAAGSLPVMAQIVIYASGLFAIPYAVYATHKEYKEKWRVRNP